MPSSEATSGDCFNQLNQMKETERDKNIIILFLDLHFVNYGAFREQTDHKAGALGRGYTMIDRCLAEYSKYVYFFSLFATLQQQHGKVAIPRWKPPNHQTPSFCFQFVNKLVKPAKISNPLKMLKLSMFKGLLRTSGPFCSC